MRFFYVRLVVILMILLSICGCVSIDVVESSNKDLYSRKNTEFIVSSKNFGKGMGDDIYTALQYIYDNDELKEKFGTSFEISPENVICYSSESGNRFFYMYKGSADYGFKFEKEIYRVKLSKSYNSKWKVDSAEFEF